MSLVPLEDTEELKMEEIENGEEAQPITENEGKKSRLTFKVNENPPLHIAIFYAFQVCISCFSRMLSVMQI